jgi:DNA transposition AAA+ family ATPase
MAEFLTVKKPAALKNVAAFSGLITKVVERRPDLPGLACFFGPSGLGKTKSAVFGANMYRAAYVECGQFTTARSLLVSILKEIGVQAPRGTITDMIEDAVRIMAGDIRRPLIVDEAHHVANKRFVDLLRELHDKSLAPVILIGEETLPKQLEAFERVHNRMLDWVAAVPCDEPDFRLLAKLYCPKLTLTDDLARAILADTRGNTRRIVVNLARAQERADEAGVDTVDLSLFGGAGSVIGSRAPLPRRAA